MSTIRVALILLQAIGNHLSTTSPSKAPAHTRYNTDTLWLLYAAPLFFTLQKPVFWALSLLELTLTLFPHILPSQAFHALCPSSSPAFSASPHVYLGIALSLFGTALRLSCYRRLGKLFTFDLSISPDHSLITSGPYAWVRHPSYAGSLCLNTGLALVHFSRGGYIATCSSNPSHAVLASIGTVWMAYYWYVAIKRARAEDDELHRRFGRDWECWAAQTKYWFFYGLI